MTLYSIRLLCSLIPLLLLGGTTAAFAQPPGQQVTMAIGGAAVEYWPSRLNIYKSAIDRIVSADDLAALDRLRVRWSILLAEQEEMRARMAERSGVDGAAGSVDLQAGITRGNEIITIMEQAEQIARRYPGGMQEVATSVIDDVQMFVAQLPGQIEQRLKESGADMSHPDVLAGRETIEKAAGTIATDRGRGGIQMVYEMAFEPIVLLYNGSDLGQMIAQAGQSVGIDGALIPGSTLLGQNFPNPASTTTTIDYTLQESSPGAAIRIYNAAGTLVTTLELGSLTAGRHSRVIDVSRLPSGSYLYQLVIAGERGEQVIAKVMKIVR